MVETYKSPESGANTNFGEQRVRASFNLSENLTVDGFKKRTAEMINRLEEMKQHTVEGEPLRLLSLAQTAYEEACMWAVKAATGG